MNIGWIYKIIKKEGADIYLQSVEENWKEKSSWTKSNKKISQTQHGVPPQEGTFKQPSDRSLHRWRTRTGANTTFYRCWSKKNRSLNKQSFKFQDNMQS